MILGEQPPAGEIPNAAVFALYDKMYATQMAALQAPAAK
jgi:hypothetical protein